jgi:hypothetical protein
MRDNNLRDRHRDIVINVTNRLALPASVTQERVVLRPTAGAIEEVLELAESYAQDADRLRDQCAMTQETVRQLEAMVATLKADRASLLAHLGARMPMEATVPAAASAVVSTLPHRNEVRFYKKRFEHRSYDVFVRVADCRCNRWQRGHSGDKARAGIAKLEGNRTDWKTIQHCPSCTGGGMWRVRW